MRPPCRRVGHVGLRVDHQNRGSVVWRTVQHASSRDIYNTNPLGTVRREPAKCGRVGRDGEWVNDQHRAGIGGRLRRQAAQYSLPVVGANAMPCHLTPPPTRGHQEW